MSDAVTIALIVALGNIVTSVIVVICRWHSSKEHVDTQKVVANIELAINGRLDQLLKLTEKSSHAQGMLEGKGKS